MRKIAIVTGSARGIGLGIASQLAKDGYNIAMIDVGDKNEESVKTIKDLGVDCLYIKADISNHDDRIRIVEETVKYYGRIDALVNNAGVAPIERADLLTMSEASWDRVIGINTKGNMFLTQAVANQMIKQDILEGEERRGVIVNISSCSTVVSSTNRGEYCVSKAGVTALTMLYADRLAKEGILVHEVRPGVIDTNMTSTVHDKYNRLIAQGEFPIARWGKPEDVAKVVSAFCSDKFNYTTGNYIDVDGGFHIRRL